jgi:hypothetical protein
MNLLRFRCAYAPGFLGVSEEEIDAMKRGALPAERVAEIVKVAEVAAEGLRELPVQGTC